MVLRFSTPYEKYVEPPKEPSEDELDFKPADGEVPDHVDNVIFALTHYLLLSDRSILLVSNKINYESKITFSHAVTRQILQIKF